MYVFRLAQAKREVRRSLGYLSRADLHWKLTPPFPLRDLFIFHMSTRRYELSVGDSVTMVHWNILFDCPGHISPHWDFVVESLPPIEPNPFVPPMGSKNHRGNTVSPTVGALGRAYLSSS